MARAPLLKLLLPALLLALLLGEAGLLYWEITKLPLPIGRKTLFEIEKGEPLAKVAERLKEEGLIFSKWSLLLYASWRGKAREIKAGEYLLKPGLTTRELLELFVAGKVHRYRFTIVEGWTVDRLLAALEEAPKLEKTLQGVPKEALLAELGLPPGHPEGRFFPDTYFYTKGMSDRQLLRRAYRRMEELLSQLWPKRQEGLPLKTPYEALILASIVQKESYLPSEQPLIAAVFYNRLKKGMPLQADPTVIYGLGERFDGDLKRSHLREETPYNTYVQKGLPPTPIALPGKSALEAVLHPARSDALFFVANGKGRHIFSRTYQEHLRAVRKYQK